jgi:hypothetical protein
MLKTGRNSTTWTPKWKHGETKTIRVPVALADEILDYAKSLDKVGQSVEKQDLLKIYQEVILKAIDTYIDYKGKNYHPNQNSKELNINTRSWDELRKFALLMENDPKSLLTPSINSEH